MTQTFGHSHYSCYVCDPYGVRLGDASSFVSLKYSRVVNDVGVATIALPISGWESAFDPNLLRLPDGRLEIWRRVPGTTREVLETETIWLMKKRTFDRDDRGRVTVTIEADTPLSILREPGRFVQYAARGDYGHVTAALDNAIKFIARYNIGSLNLVTPTQRNVSAYVTIAPDLSLAPSDTKVFGWRECLKAMQEMAQSSAEQGVYLAFDLMAPTPDTLQFRTYVQQRGVDHRFPGGLNPVIIGPEFGNMGMCQYSTDWRNEVTFVYAVGSGDEVLRWSASAQDDARIAASPFGVREKFVNAGSYDTLPGLQGEAESVLWAGRPRTIFKGRILDTPGTRYGVHWGWGDFVTVQAFDQSFDARIDAITVTVERGKETIDAWIRSDL